MAAADDKKAPITSDVGVRKLVHPGDIKRPYVHAVTCDGVKGLRIQVSPTGTKSWLLRYTVNGKQRETGLGPYPAVSLADAREKARTIYKGLKAEKVVDPVKAKRAEKVTAIAAARKERTFSEAVEDYMKSGRLEALKSDKLRAQRRYVLETYATPIIGKMLIEEITDEDVQRVLSPIWRKMPATADKTLQYMSGVFTTAIAHKYRTTANPATRKVLLEWIGTMGVRKTKHHPAVAIDDAPQWFAAVRAREGTGALALQFVALTAARVGMVRDMTWGEVKNFETKRIWSIPAARMKTGRKKTDQSAKPKPFRVPLSDEAIALLKGIERREGTDFVFPAARDGMLSDMTLLKVMQAVHAAELKAGRVGWIDEETGEPAVPHGLRSTFRGWVSEKTTYAWEMGEVALAHSVGSKTQKAYDRGDMIERRREMMNDWANYLMGREAVQQADPVAAALALLIDSGLTPEDIAARLAGDNVVPLRAV